MKNLPNQYLGTFSSTKIKKILCYSLFSKWWTIQAKNWEESLWLGDKRQKS